MLKSCFVNNNKENNLVLLRFGIQAGGQQKDLGALGHVGSWSRLLVWP